MRSAKEYEAGSGFLRRLVSGVNVSATIIYSIHQRPVPDIIMSIDQRLLDQDPAQAMPDEHDRPHQTTHTLDMHSFKQIIRLMHKSLLRAVEGRARIVLIEKNPGMWNHLRQLVPQPKIPTLARRLPPSIKGMLGIAPGIQTMDSNDTVQASVGVGEKCVEE